MFAPVCQTSGASHVQPISRLRCSGRSERKRLLPDDLPVGLPDRRERKLEPGGRVRERALDVVA